MSTTDPDSSRSTDQPSEAVSRRDFLRVGGLSVVGLSMAESTVPAREQAAGTAERQSARSCILILMAGGASQLDTFDPKPEAPAEIRGPSHTIATAIPGVCFSESLPRLAVRANRLAVIRSLYHEAAPNHESGLQLLQTGRLVRQGLRFPCFGSVIASALGPRQGVPAYVVVGEPLRGTGLSAHCGQSAGFLGGEHDPRFEPVLIPAVGTHHKSAEDRIGRETEPVRRAYGETSFGQRCLRARQLVEEGVRCVTVNLFDAIEGGPTWDCHAQGPSPANLYDYRDTLVPQFDQALAGLLDDLEQRGLLDSTLVVAAGEFGRTPRVNASAGREHWTGAWSILAAGGGVVGGRVIGATDGSAAAPVDRPVHPAEIVATIYERMGVNRSTTLSTGAEADESCPLTESASVSELF